MLSRFRSDAEQRDDRRGHRTTATSTSSSARTASLQKDVQFKDLGSSIIDEEQRFGVSHKERLKQMRAEVDVLTLSATPIPRTLHMSLAGIRDMTTMMTPPEDRLPIRTYVTAVRRRHHPRGDRRARWSAAARSTSCTTACTTSSES